MSKNIAYATDSMIENNFGIIPNTYNYKLTDDDFLRISTKIIENTFNIKPKLSFSIDYNDNIHLFAGDDILKSILNKSVLNNNDKMNEGYTVLNFILRNLFNNAYIENCSTLYRDKDKYYINIEVKYFDNSILKIKNNLNNNENKNYYLLTKQIEILQNKKLDILKNSNCIQNKDINQ